MTSSSNTEELAKAANDFISVVDSCFGLYLDCREGCRELYSLVLRAQQEFIASPHTSEHNIKSIEDMDRLPHFIGKGAPTDPTNIMYHKCTQGEFKERNAHDGQNDKAISRYCIVLLYEYWESEFRQRFAQAIGINRDELRHDLFGDLRYLRNAIIHNGGTATQECASLKLLERMQIGDEISVSTDELYKVVRTIKAFVDDLVRSQTGHDPTYRTIWHVQ